MMAAAMYWINRRIGRFHCGDADLSLTPFQSIVVDKLLSAPDGIESDRLLFAIYSGSGIREPGNPGKVLQGLICQLRKLGLPIETHMHPGRGGGSAVYCLVRN